MATHRPAVRIVCLDRANRVLLLNWRDPTDGTLLWEPPGGGVEPGETPLEAAGRELVEETGLDPTAILDRSVTVHRDMFWNGQHKVGPEPFFLARYPQDRPRLAPRGLTPEELAELVGHAWVPWSEIEALSGTLEPPLLLAVLAELDPTGPWR
ncbi:NUDIX domain-containing protein [Actinophytocola xanthii]|uniref:NUDIX hydrolase n=1 Tax=Actinophytocola xanthii TaxID=1912961 RepID=A0A1Q8C0J2_9PSEU|nr:NUDIX hydrolase [Actinophytocola xanthii]OLF07877.1 NUDIX hydrolase [Actinophytocola xanthii]